jgi:hypothetical protein
VRDPFGADKRTVSSGAEGSDLKRATAHERIDEPVPPGVVIVARMVEPSRAWVQCTQAFFAMRYVRAAPARIRGAGFLPAEAFEFRQNFLDAGIRARKNRDALRESWCTEGDGPGRCERGDPGHDRDRAFREKGAALYPICRNCGIKSLLTEPLGPLFSLPAWVATGIAVFRGLGDAS